ncbi:hypothetical protein ACQ4LE_010385 [Meloidogyne hapla]|uniref:EGF-like domain-containing protein n=1 Tax=Meloidogyne hapla TaxID=6305 RepID=A0A1I8B8J2_MELHA
MSNINSSYNYDSTTLSSPSLRYFLNHDIHNCSGLFCSSDSLCMKHRDWPVPTYCVHKNYIGAFPTECDCKNSIDNVAQHLANVPCNSDGIVQHIIVGILLVILLIQIALFVLFCWRSPSRVSANIRQHQQKNYKRKDEYSNKSLSPSICNTSSTNVELMTLPRLKLANTNLAYETTNTNLFYDANNRPANNSLFHSEYSVPFQQV